MLRSYGVKPYAEELKSYGVKELSRMLRSYGVKPYAFKAFSFYSLE